MSTPTSRDLFRAIQAKNAPAATSVFNSIVKDRLQSVIAREYREVAADFFGGVSGAKSAK